MNRLESILTYERICECFTPYFVSELSLHKSILYFILRPSYIPSAEFIVIIFHPTGIAHKREAACSLKIPEVIFLLF